MWLKYLAIAVGIVESEERSILTKVRGGGEGIDAGREEISESAEDWDRPEK